MPRPRKPRTIAQWLELTGKTQAELGDLIGVAQPVVSRWIRGVESPEQRHWPKLAKVTGLPITAFMRPEVAAELGGRA